MGEPAAGREDRARKILLVDDDRLLRKAATAALGRHGFTVATAQNGEEALRAVASDPPDLILLDLVMPGLPGYAVLKALQGDAATSRIPVVVLTNLGGQDADVTHALESGAADYAIKVNLALGDLVALVRRILG